MPHAPGSFPGTDHHPHRIRDSHRAIDGVRATAAHAAELHGRLLLVHGSYDDNVHPRNEQALIDALVTAGKTFNYMVYPMRQHDIADRAARRHLYETMIEFWERNLVYQAVKIGWAQGTKGAKC